MRGTLGVLASVALSVKAATLEHWWNISYAEANPDGVSSLRVSFLSYTRHSWIDQTDTE
jgi:ABC-type uncharacterized transport system YnjBCD substrate-binding protein